MEVADLVKKQDGLITELKREISANDVALQRYKGFDGKSM